MMAAMALLLFPKLALGLSGFETGVAVMPLVRATPATPTRQPAGRIRNTKKLLRTAALIMSVMLIGSSFVTTLLIPPAAFQPGGQADGRALAYLAHERLGSGFGTLYDISTIAILWFAGASAMAGLLNLVPRYLPRYGMAPEWARATRPLVLIFTAITIVVTLIFDADVEAQGGAYATGVLVLMTSAAVAVAITPGATASAQVAVLADRRRVRLHDGHEHHRAARRHQDRVVLHRGDRATSLVSRGLRSTELRVRGVEPDDRRRASSPRPLAAARSGSSPTGRTTGRSANTRASCTRRATRIIFRSTIRVLFLEVQPGDASQFSRRPRGAGRARSGRIACCAARARRSRTPSPRCCCTSAIDRAAFRTSYFGWTEGNPITYLLKFLAFGEGDTAPVTREVLRQSEPDPLRRPRVHVG